MPSIYSESPSDSASLRQCEILADVVENRVILAASEPVEDESPPVQPVRYPYLIIMTNDCDLYWDHRTRLEVTSDQREADEDWERNYHRISPHVVLCEAFIESEIKGLHDLNTKRLERVKKNQEERLHLLPGDPSRNVPDLYVDFKKHLSIPTQSIYDAMASGKITRLAILEGDRHYDLIHRFYSYLSRIGVAEET